MLAKQFGATERDRSERGADKVAGDGAIEDCRYSLGPAAWEHSGSRFVCLSDPAGCPGIRGSDFCCSAGSRFGTGIGLLKMRDTVNFVTALEFHGSGSGVELRKPWEKPQSWNRRQARVK